MTTDLLKKRDFEVKILRDAGFDPVVPDGGYFIMTDTSKLGRSVGVLLFSDGVKTRIIGCRRDHVR